MWPKSLGVSTIPRPKWYCQMRLTIDRQVSGLRGVDDPVGQRGRGGRLRPRRRQVEPRREPGDRVDAPGPTSSARRLLTAALEHVDRRGLPSGRGERALRGGTSVAAAKTIPVGRGSAAICDSIEASSASARIQLVPRAPRRPPARAACRCVARFARSPAASAAVCSSARARSSTRRSGWRSATRRRLDRVERRDGVVPARALRRRGSKTCSSPGRR